MSSSPTQRTLKLYRDNGFVCQVVERWCQYSRRRIDLFGVIDIAVLDTSANPWDGVLGLQACAGDSHAARRTKILASPEAKLWLMRKNRLQIVSWAKRGPRGQVKRWTHRVEEITLDMFAPEG